MTTKKKTPAASKTLPDTVPHLSASGPPPEAPPRPADLQLRTWDKAVRCFSQRRYEEAIELFRETARGPAVHIADKARSYCQICERKTAKPDTEFRTAEDHFYYGVERMNARDLDQAQLHLGHALRLQPDGDHIFYTLSLCCGFAGDGSAACENLKRAIDLEPRNRLMARQDTEFTALAQRFPAIRTLLNGDANA